MNVFKRTFALNLDNQSFKMPPFVDIAIDKIAEQRQKPKNSTNIPRFKEIQYRDEEGCIKNAHVPLHMSVINKITHPFSSESSELTDSFDGCISPSLYTIEDKSTTIGSILELYTRIQDEDYIQECKTKQLQQEFSRQPECSINSCSTELSNIFKTSK